MPFNPDKLAKLQAKSAAARTGGKGTVRRKHKVVRRATAHDDKRLKATLNKLQVRDIPGIEEVNLFKDDDTIIHFAQPKVQASIAANTYVVSGTAENKKLTDLLPGILPQLGRDNMDAIKRMLAQMTSQQGGAEGLASMMAAAKKAAGGAAAAGGDDDDIPDLVENFDEVANQLD